MARIAGLSYGHSIAYPMRLCREVWDNAALACVLEFIHPDNLGTLPPSPDMVAGRGIQVGLGKLKDFRKTIYWNA